MIKVKFGNLRYNTMKPYPKLMKGVTNDCIILFTSEKVGTVLHVGSKGILQLGQHTECFQSDMFVDYDGPITLENE